MIMHSSALSRHSAFRPRKSQMRALALLLAGCAALSGCAGRGDMAGYPSLAPRAVERIALSVPSSSNGEGGIPPVVSAPLADAIRALAADADRGDAAFRQALADQSVVVAQGRSAATGSEGWALAERALSRIEVARGPSLLALTELDRLALTTLDADGSALPPVLAAEQARVAAMVAAQDAAIRALPQP